MNLSPRYKLLINFINLIRLPFRNSRQYVFYLGPRRRPALQVRVLFAADILDLGKHAFVLSGTLCVSLIVPDVSSPSLAPVQLSFSPSHAVYDQIIAIKINFA